MALPAASGHLPRTLSATVTLWSLEIQHTRVVAASGVGPSRSWVGYYGPDTCWRGWFTFERCCTEWRASRECFADSPQMYQPCCLYLKVPPAQLPVDVSGPRLQLLGDAVHADFDAHWYWLGELGSSTGFDGLFPRLLSSRTMDEPTEIWLGASGCCEVAWAKALMESTNHIALELISISADNVRCAATSIINTTGYLNPSSACTDKWRTHDYPRLLAMLRRTSESNSDTCCNVEHASPVRDLRCCRWALPGIGDLLTVFAHHNNSVEAALDNMKLSKVRGNWLGTGIAMELHFNRMGHVVDDLIAANRLLVSKLLFIRAIQQDLAPHERARLPPIVSQDRYCCTWLNMLEGIAQELFVESAFHPVRIVELGVRDGVTSLHLLSRYDWIDYVGVDILQDRDGHRYDFSRNVSHIVDALRKKFKVRVSETRTRLMLPETTLRAARRLSKEGKQVDMAILDARFSRYGFVEDVLSWAPLVRPGGFMVARWGFTHLMRLMMSGAEGGQRWRFGNVHIGSCLESCIFYWKVW